ncbi:MAG: hypothetical protein IKJ65_07985 [Clostridia bacterium]|nr:hypothetical protein [Clostridia bacterium]
MISIRDKERLRELACKHMEYATNAENDRILNSWHALSRGKRETPTVRLLFSNFMDEVVDNRLVCENEQARSVERRLVSGLVGRELFNDDTPIAPYFPVSWSVNFTLFGVQPVKSRSIDPKAKGFHIEPVIENLEADFDKLRGGGFSVDRADTEKNFRFAEEIFGDILPVKMTMGSLTGAITNPLVQLMGMENYYFAMYDTPDALHALMDMATGLYEDYYDFLERERLLLPTSEFSPVAQESFAFNSELPTDKAEKTTDVWGFLESQETTAVSKEMFGEFVYPYQDRLVKKYGLLSYGCCERVDAIWPDYLSKWKNLRKLSVSPFNNENRIGEYLRGSNVVYYSKPRAEYVTNPGPMDENALRKSFKNVCEAASGCLFEIAQREVGTIFGDYSRGKRYVEILKECIGEYWKP